MAYSYYSMKVINHKGEVDGYYKLLSSPAAEAKKLYDGSNFYILYKDTVFEDGHEETELIGSWGNPIAFERSLGAKL